MTPSLSSPTHTYEVLGNRMVFHREFDAPRELVYRAWTAQRHLETWWGPSGFRTTSSEFAFRVGGLWTYIMHGPDGTDWPNRIKYGEIVPNERIAYRHDEGGDDDLHAFDVVASFIDLGDNRTRLDMELVFADEATAAKIVEIAGAIDGHAQTMQRLEDFLPALRDRDVVAPIDLPQSRPSHSYEVEANAMIFHREFDAPRSLVFRAWTEQLHLEMWWGPTGFRTTTNKFDFRVGGTWDHIMHGPDGTDYPNQLEFTEITPDERITYRQNGGRTDDRHGFDVVITFIDLGDNRTRLDMAMAFADEAAARTVEANYGAIAGHQQTMQRLEDFLPALHDREVSTASGVFTITREFAAPIDLVWRAWTEADRLKQWFGPEGFSIPHCTIEPTVGGRWHLAMRDDSTGQDHWCGGVYSVVKAPNKLVFTDYFSTPEGEMIDTADMGMPDFPSRNTVTVTFESLGPHRTRMLLVNDTPVAAAQKYMADFGWGSSFVKLQRLLAAGE